ncbi:TVP38/TMEM64 family protein [Candidatus Gracilibacteria bacterium]|nr:TVP38/TMEM64 family protein [Candidatus Gracilibacteria bacterium]
MFKKAKKYVLLFWILLLATFGLFLFYNPHLLDPKEFALFIEQFGMLGLALYAILFLFRGLLLVPSTPLILVGMILFPNDPNAVFAISMTGILFSSFIIYQFSDILGLDDYFASNVKNKSIQEKIEKYGFFAVAFWSFFLILPTDLICYIAGAVRMNIYKFLSAVALGEGFIIAIFIYGGRDALSILLDFLSAL